MKLNTFNFTKASLEALDGKGTIKSYHDTKESALTIMVMPSGIKTFYLYRKINGKPERVKIGRYPDLSVENARMLAAKLKNTIAFGVNPNEEKKKIRQELTFIEFFKIYIDRYAKLHKKTWKQDEKEVQRLLQCLFYKRLPEILKQDIQQIHEDLLKNNGLYMANRMLDRVKAIYNKAIEWGYNGINPCIGIKKFKEKSRDRFLQPDEIERLLQVLNESENETIRDYIYLSLLTGARKSNVLSMKWSDINIENKTWRIVETKNGDNQTIPLMFLACEILKLRKEKLINDIDKSNINKLASEFVFGSTLGTTGHLVEPKRGWNTILKRSNIEDLRIHDLRRTLGSLLAASGANSYIIGKSLGHKSQASTAVYARLNIDPVRDAMEKATKVFGILK